MKRGDGDCEALLARLECFVRLSSEQRAAIMNACFGSHYTVRAKADFLRQGDRMSGLHILTKGWAYRLLMLPDGRRQIAGFLIPGDICMTEVPDVRLDFSLSSLTDSTYLHLSNQTLDRLRAAYPAVGEGLAIHNHVASAILRNWVLNLGQRNAFERIGHLFCEMLIRLRCIGMAENDGYHFPVTQIELAEATGLTPVHVNRTIQDMRARGLVSLQNRELKILDFARLANLVMFDPAYLHPVTGGCAQDG